MAHALRDRNTPKALSQSRQVIDFEGPISTFDQFCRVLDEDLAALDEADRPKNWRAEPLVAHLEFGFADLAETLPAVAGRVAVEVVQVCQRCLEVTDVSIDADFRYLLVHGKHSDIEGYDVWELHEPVFRPSDLVEEVLTMALPLMAMHEQAEDCGPLARKLDAAPAETSESVRPFSDLRTLMKNKD